MGTPKIKKCKQPIVTEFHDYREYLAHLLEYLKVEKKISTRMLTKKMGVSHGYFTLILNRQRNLSLKSLEKLLPHIDLDAKEEKYLKNIVLIADGRTTKIRNQAIKNLNLSKNYRNNHPKEFETHQYLEKWYYIAIRELSLTQGFQSDARWIKSQLALPIRISDVEKAIDFLVAHDFLQRSSSGKLTPTTRSVSCIGGVFRLSLSNYHSQMLKMAQQAIDLYKPIQRKQIGYSMVLPKDQLEKAKAILEDAREKLKALEAEHQADSDTVYHVNLSAFPIAGKGCFE